MIQSEQPNSQEVKVMLQLTLDVDVKLSKEEILKRIERMISDNHHKGIELIIFDVVEFREEAEIYGTEEDSPEMQAYYKKYNIDKKRQTKLDL